MRKTILITGATDGIGLETAKRLAADGHRVLLHGRSPEKLDAARAAVGGDAQTYAADLVSRTDVESLAREVADDHERIDVLINNAGVFKTANPVTHGGFDTRFVVNVFAPFLLTRALLPRIASDGRIVNLSSAAQSPVDLEALAGKSRLADMDAYAQSKLALTMWSCELAAELGPDQVAVAVNPGSLLASKMVREGFGVAGHDLGIGAEILVRAALGDSFVGRSGQYFDNDAGRFGPPHADAANAQTRQRITAAIAAAVDRW